jgi:hypothetical protein
MQKIGGKAKRKVVRKVGAKKKPFTIGEWF